MNFDGLGGNMATSFSERIRLVRLGGHPMVRNTVPGTHARTASLPGVARCRHVVVAQVELLNAELNSEPYGQLATN